MFCVLVILGWEGKGRKQFHDYMVVFIETEKLKKEEEITICHRNRLLLQNHRMVEVGKILGLFHFPQKGTEDNVSSPPKLI